jgi:hypothetical protein
MVNARVSLDRKVQSDLKKSYKAHRRHFLAGDISAGSWKPKYDFYQFSTFEELVEEASAELDSIVQRAAAECRIGSEEEVDIAVKRSSDMNYNGGCYLRSREGRPMPRIELTVDYIYGIYSTNDDVNSAGLESVRKTAVHEFRHHLDREFIRAMDVLHILRPELRHHPNRYTINVKRHLFRYLADVRIEGFARFSRKKHTLPGESDPMKKIMGEKDVYKQPEKAQSLRAGLFCDNLEQQTTTVAKVFGYLLGMDTIKHGELLEITNEFFAHKNPLGLETTFSPYDQGTSAFHVLAFAEMKRGRGLEGTAQEVLASLFLDGEFPEQVYEWVCGKTLATSTLGGFYSWLYDSASELCLPDRQLIVPKEYANQFIVFEKKK